MKTYKFIISGGGTGGHIFPAISIADGLKERYPDCQILFVGAEHKMEMEKVPAVGYAIEGLPVAGFHRGEIWRNLSFPFKLLRSMMKARKIVTSFRPDCVIGVGGYASGPVLRVATNKGLPTVIQEQNSFAGVTNKILARKVDKICVAYDKMERFFPAEKIVFTGNPIRSNLVEGQKNVREAAEFFRVDESKPVLLIVGGSLGARSINDSLLARFDALKDSGIQVIWQTGKFYYKSISEKMEGKIPGHIHLMEFIPRMDLAYAVADLVISRAGAGTISELCLVGKPSILVPSPNVAEDHQTRNAMALVEKDAAVLVNDSEAKETLVPEALKLIADKPELEKLAVNSTKMALPNATRDIVGVIAELLEKKKS
ncbi:undecaprenyldiphospho-muramoylpentapeptide beta-N-acetylglucosaminyltransferase [Prolixibacter sp. SD074]|uniref:undecaprenyldiphospho-muramoylpentapeptide beta-N-acetylglucosaminyltransferase n=1 Tax=Prolixibacter sp. SD074 TaxID=2652391 RepID=UPI0012785F12|nr:undecaprenyldiphospho-muramoylpentapeptide beta-N-acetylglucosaminyltransferase [Prolixibacter sp. SD074]GET30135.1 UDP-N-acetylglucosamine--N-acetylmuramyl-(pentapeptide) pyrophosphoryl-undecaprenol N-acetylglucosamine transferase [Prolixibacter sp. SD074]